ncbi:cyclic nucleotide-binding domain-containing protein [Candidatus Gracilibacteria bacterium]|nr:cyclic nucleotide-binding domain-containing protein [Candidatus Gracilibacteria bacterium]
MDLKNIYIFEGLSDEELSYFDTIAKKQSFKKGDFIISEGDKSNDNAYIIESGFVEVFHKGEKLATINEGDIFGEIALIVNEPRASSVIAGDDLKLLAFNRNDFVMLYKKSGNFEQIRNKIFQRIKKSFYGIKE